MEWAKHKDTRLQLEVGETEKGKYVKVNCNRIVFKYISIVADITKTP